MVEPMELKETVYMMKSLNMHLRLERYPYHLFRGNLKSVIIELQELWIYLKKMDSLALLKELGNPESFLINFDCDSEKGN